MSDAPPRLCMTCYNFGLAIVQKVFPNPMVINMHDYEGKCAACGLRGRVFACGALVRLIGAAKEKVGEKRLVEIRQEVLDECMTELQREAAL